MSDDQLPTYSTDYGLPWASQDPQSAGGSWSPQEGKSLLLDLFMLAVVGLHCLLSIPFFCDSVQPGGPWVRIILGVLPALFFVAYSVFRVSSMGSNQPGTVHTARVEAAPVFVGCLGVIAAIVQWFSTGTGLFLALSAALSGPTAVTTRFSVHKLSGTSPGDNTQSAEVSLPGETSTFTIAVGEVNTPGRPQRPFDIDVPLRSGAGPWFEKDKIAWVLDLYKFEYIPSEFERNKQGVRNWKSKTMIFVVEPQCPTSLEIETLRQLKAKTRGPSQALVGISSVDYASKRPCDDNVPTLRLDDYQGVEFIEFLSVYLHRKTPQPMDAYVFVPGGHLLYAGPISVDMPLNLP